MLLSYGPQAPPKGPIQPYDPSFYDEFAAPEYGGFVSSDSRGGNGMPRGGSMSLGPSMRSNMRSGGRLVNVSINTTADLCCKYVVRSSRDSLVRRYVLILV